MTYEYACRSCGHHWECEQSIKDPPVQQCRACGANAAERLISSGNFQLIGSCWASDGYGKRRK